MEYLMSFQELSFVLKASLFTGEGGQAAEPCSQGFSSVCIDSREAKEGCLFVALKGEFLDGHNFVEAAFAGGAAGALVALSALEDEGFSLLEQAKKWKRILVAVEDTLKAFQNAAAAYLKKFHDLFRIGITGSAGKTTTKEIAASMIAHEKTVVMNKGNLNSETGLPLSVFEVRSDHQVGIFEAAMSRPGEMGVLAEILNPHLALITNIGSAHIGYLGSRERIAEEKKQIFSAFTGNNTALIPNEDDYRDFLAKDLRGKVVFYGASNLAGLGQVKDLGLGGAEIVFGGEAVRFALPGKFNLHNAIAAAAIAGELGIEAASIRKGLESARPLFGRGEIFSGRITLIRDCYNSSPESAIKAVDFCDELDWPGRRIYVMGSMLELGAMSMEIHAALGRRLSSSRTDKVFLYGEETKAAALVIEKSSVPCFFTADKEELSRELNDYVKTGDLVLLKASRACALETLTEKLIVEETNVL